MKILKKLSLICSKHFYCLYLFKVIVQHCSSAITDKKLRISTEHLEPTRFRYLMQRLERNELPKLWLTFHFSPLVNSRIIPKHIPFIIIIIMNFLVVYSFFIRLHYLFNHNHYNFLKCDWCISCFVYH